MQNLTLPKKYCCRNSELNTLFLSEIFNAYPGLDPSIKGEMSEAEKLLDDNVEGAREKRAFRIWKFSLGLSYVKREPIHINKLIWRTKRWYSILLLRTIERIRPKLKNWKIIDKKPKNSFKKTVNSNEVIEATKKAKYHRDIRDGNKKYILAIDWRMIRDHSLHGAMKALKVNWISEIHYISLNSWNLLNQNLLIGILLSQIKNDETKKIMQNAVSIIRKLCATIFLVWEYISELEAGSILLS